MVGSGQSRRPPAKFRAASAAAAKCRARAQGLTSGESSCMKTSLHSFERCLLVAVFMGTAVLDKLDELRNQKEYTEQI